MGSDFPLNFQALADSVRGAVKNFSKVSAGLLLHENTCNNYSKILRWNAVKHLGHGVAYWKTKVLLLEYFSELRTHRLRGLLCDNRSEERRVGKECRSRW